MQNAPHPLTLIRLSPDHDLAHGAALRLAAQLAHILNTDDGLPPGLRRPADLSPETAEGVLSFTTKWCLERTARFFALVLPNETVVGALTLSHIDLEKKTAQTGYFLSSAHKNERLELQAATLGCDFAKSLGITTISSSIADKDSTLQTILERAGYSVEIRDGRIMVRF